MPRFKKIPFLQARDGDHPLDWADPREDFATGAKTYEPLP